MERNKNSTTIIGRKVSTLPTPASTPSTATSAYHGVGAERREPASAGDDGSDAVLHEALQRRADHAKRQPKDQAHDDQKRRDGCVTTRQDAVDLARSARARGSRAA